MNKELYIKHSFDFLNTLHSIGQGKYVFYNILNKFKVEQYEEEIREMIELIDFCSIWLGKLWEDQPVLEMDEQGKEALFRMNKIIEDFSIFLGEIEILMQKEKIEKEDYITFLAILGRHSYTREAYIKGLITFGEKRQREDIADRYRQHLPSLQAEINDTNRRVYLFEKTKNTEDAHEIHRICKHLPGVFQEQVKGMRALLDQYEKDGGNITFHS